MSNQRKEDGRSTDWPYAPYAVSVFLSAILLAFLVLHILDLSSDDRGEGAVGLYMLGFMSIPATIVLAALSASTYPRYRALRSLASRVLFYALIVLLTAAAGMGSTYLAWHAFPFWK